MSDAQLFNTTFTIQVGSESFEFAAPSIGQRIRLGARARAIRRVYDPSGFGDEWGLDDETATLAWGVAAFETLLTGCDAKDNWPYSKDERGAPVVDHTKWKANMGYEDTILEVARKLREDMARFRENRAADRQPPGTEDVASGGHSGTPGSVQ